jgi:anti-sigma B factor antagonist
VPAGELNRRSTRQRSASLRLQAVICDGLRALRLEGELDLASRTILEDAIARIATRGAAVVLDLRALTFMDASGVHVALGAQELCAVRGCELRLIPGPAAVQRVFELAGALDDLPFQAEESCPRPELSGGDSEAGAVPGQLAARAKRPRRELSSLSPARRAPLRRLWPRHHGL